MVMTVHAPLPELLVEPLVRAALAEDLGRAGDITTDAIVPPDKRGSAVMATRATGVVAGLQPAAIAFRLLDPDMSIETLKPDGAAVAPGDAVMRIQGSARALLSAERVALNFACGLSGVATATADLVRRAAGHKAMITCTRKTTPGLRALQKAAVRAGGGANHRFGLDDAVLIKDNHVALAGGVAPAIARVRAAVGHLVKIEVEVDTLEQLRQAMTAAPDAVLLDNMPPDVLKEAVGIIAGRAVAEASGGITPETVADIAASGVDLISAGWLTHSAKSLDLGLDIELGA